MALQVSGFVNGLDVPTIVSQLMQSESQSQTMLKTQLSSVRTDASAYRSVNSTFAALLTAAQQLNSSSFGTTMTAASTNSTVVANATTGATPGSSVSFSVTGLAAAKSEISNATWTSPTALASSAGLSLPLTVLDANGNAVGNPISLASGATLNDLASAINTGGYGLVASIVQTDTNAFRLQVGSKSTGLANSFSLQAAGDASPDLSFTKLSDAADAKLNLGSVTTPVYVSSSSNTFSNLLNGVSVTVGPQTTGPTTITVGTDNSAITKQMQTLVNAANAALSSIKINTDTSPGTTAALPGDYTLQSLAQQVLQAVSDVVTSTDPQNPSGSPVQAGLQLNSDGTIAFDATKFSAALTTNPDLVKRLVAGTTPTPGVASRRATLATSATDSVTGTLVTLANGEDAQVKDIQSQIDAWTVRLAARQESLTQQYSNLQSMLSTLQSQQSWLSGMFASATSSSAKSSS